MRYPASVRFKPRGPMKDKGNAVRSKEPSFSMPTGRGAPSTLAGAEQGRRGAIRRAGSGALALALVLGIGGTPGLRAQAVTARVVDPVVIAPPHAASQSRAAQSTPAAPAPPKKTLAPSPAASVPEAGGSAAAAGSPSMGRGHRMMASPGPGNTPGWSLMSPQERQQHHQRLKAMKTRRECEQFVQDHHREMMARAQQRHRPEPHAPHDNPCQELP
jgi:hypothetical protein